jgi:transposase-like protein
MNQYSQQKAPPNSIHPKIRAEWRAWLSAGDVLDRLVEYNEEKTWLSLTIALVAIECPDCQSTEVTKYGKSPVGFPTL